MVAIEIREKYRGGWFWVLVGIPDGEELACAGPFRSEKSATIAASNAAEKIVGTKVTAILGPKVTATKKEK